MPRKDHAADVIAAAIHWWEMRRPRSFTLNDHIRNPNVNISGESEKAIAEAVGRFFSNKLNPNQERVMVSKIKAPSYKKAIDWIAFNDNPGGYDRLDAEKISVYISVALVADLFGKDVAEVTASVVAARQREDLDQAVRTRISKMKGEIHAGK